MNKDLLETQWVQIRDIIKEKFSNLSEEDIRQINGRYDQLVAKLQQKYGYSKEEAEEKIRNWNFDRFATPRSGVTTDERIRDERVRQDTNDWSAYKWPLLIGIPLVLLAGYLLSNRNPEMTTRAPVTQEQMIREAPADRTISTGIRNTLVPLTNQSSSMQTIQVTTQDGVVTLSGTVPSTEMRDSVARAAQNYPGVTRVINRLEVR